MVANHKENIEQAILDAAEHEFLTKGYSGTKTTDIAKMAGVNHAMLHYYFRTKENLFDVIVNKYIEMLKTMVTATLDLTEMSFIEKVRFIVGAHFDFIRQNQNIPCFVFNEMLMKPDFFKEIKQRMNIKVEQMPVFNTLVRELDEAVSNGEIRLITLVDLWFDILSLNLMTFIVLPSFKELLGSVIDDETFLDSRRKENIETVISRLTI